jgi:hypothetical protein
MAGFADMISFYIFVCDFRVKWVSAFAKATADKSG